MTAQLYCFGESGNAYKCALALTLTVTPWQARYVDFFNGETRTAEYRALNEMGEVPVLVTGDEVLTQSGSILLHIAAQSGQMGGTTAQDTADILRWILWDNHKLSTQIGTVRFLMNFLPADKRPEAVIPFLQGRLKAAYTVLNDHLASRDWIVGSAPRMRVSSVTVSPSIGTLKSTRTRTRRSLCVEVTRRSVPNGSDRWAAVSAPWL